MIFNATYYQVFPGKNSTFLLVDYELTMDVPAGTSRWDEYVLPELKSYGNDYLLKIQNMLVRSESTNFNIKVVDDPVDFNTDQYLLYVEKINLMYSETDLDIFLQMFVPGQPKLIMKIDNNSPTDITSINVRIVYEIFLKQAPSGFSVV
mgnify:CR=1 FL=1